MLFYFFGPDVALHGCALLLVQSDAEIRDAACNASSELKVSTWNPVHLMVLSPTCPAHLTQLGSQHLQCYRSHTFPDSRIPA